MDKIEIELVEGRPSQEIMDILLEADPNKEKIEKYLEYSRLYIGMVDEELIGAFVLTPQDEYTMELMNISVTPSLQNRGWGDKLLQEAISISQKLGYERIELGTGSFGYQLKFYQRAGFRPDRIIKDFFIDNYHEPIYEFGIQHMDMIRLVKLLKK